MINNPILLEAVESSEIDAIGYDAPTHMLAVQFKRGGSLYHYSGVPAALFADFLKAESKGKFFAAHVKGDKRLHPQGLCLPEDLAMSDQMIHRPIFLRFTDRHGKHYVDQVTTCLAEGVPIFVEDLRAAHAKEGGKVELISREEYDQTRFFKSVR